MAQYVYRRPPYPSYDMEGIESWLEDLITDGLWLDKDGFVFGFMQFQPGAAKHLKYRLEPIEKLNIFFPVQTPPPSEKALELYEEFGWEYLGVFYDFYIYRSKEESSVELNTDPALQAQALAHVRRRSGIFLAVAVMFPILFLFILARRWPLINVIEQGWESFAVLLALLAMLLFYSLASYLHTVGLQKKLERGEALIRSKNWRRGSMIRKALLSLPLILYCLYPYLNATSVNAIYDHEIDPAAYTEPLPFVTILELAPKGTLEYNASPFLSIWDTPLTPINIRWSESVRRADSQGDLGSGELEVNYHEASGAWIAKELIREYKLKQDRRVDELNSPGITYSNADFRGEDYGFDELYVYDSFFNTVILIRDGNTVIRAACALHTWGDSDARFHLWLEQMAERMA